MSEPRETVYLDYNATAPVRPEAARAVAQALDTVGNASSVHGYGRAAHSILENARESVAALVNAAAAEVIFTSGGTEANNLALGGAGRREILVSAVEHDSVLAAAPEALRIPVDEAGVVSPETVRRALSDTKANALVSVMLANNETGTLQPVAEIAEVAHRFGALVHCDAIQGPGKCAVDFRALGVDMLSLSAHKFGGPQGSGALVVREDLDLRPQIRGGGQERRRRAGTENLPGIAGFGAAARALMENPDDIGRLRGWRDRLEAGARERVPQTVVYGEGADRLPNTSCLGVPGVDAETQVMALDLAGVAVSAGSACSSGKVTPSHVLKAMGAADEEAASAIRVSLGWASRESDIERFLDAWSEFVERKTAA